MDLQPTGTTLALTGGYLLVEGRYGTRMRSSAILVMCAVLTVSMAPGNTLPTRDRKTAARVVKDWELVGTRGILLAPVGALILFPDFRGEYELWRSSAEAAHEARRGADSDDERETATKNLIRVQQEYVQALQRLHDKVSHQREEAVALERELLLQVHKLERQGAALREAEEVIRILENVAYRARGVRIDVEWSEDLPSDIRTILTERTDTVFRASDRATRKRELSRLKVAIRRVRKEHKRSVREIGNQVEAARRVLDVVQSTTMKGLLLQIEFCIRELTGE